MKLTLWANLLLLILIGRTIYGSEMYMLPAKDTFLLQVHGIDSNRYTWYKPDRFGKPDLVNGPSDLWFHYLARELKLDDQLVFSFSFSEPSGYHGKNMLELGAIGYRSEASNSDVPNNKGEVEKGIPKSTGIRENLTWIEQAVFDYRNNLYGNLDVNPSSRKIWQDSTGYHRNGMSKYWVCDRQ